MAYDSTHHLRSFLEQLEQRAQELEALRASDPDLQPLIAEELTSIQTQIAQTQQTMGEIARVDDTPHFTNCILELRGGAGGDEAKIWADDLMQMYIRYAELKKFKIEALDESVIKIIGTKAYDTFRFESGVHRVQRVPATEAQGRIHTSTASVACIPEIPEQQIEIREEDLVWQFTRAGGKGGQNVNKVNTAVLLRHTPSGIMVNARQERSQEQNRQIALMMLRSALWERAEEKRLAQIGAARSVVGRAQRAEKIRTYNFPQNRLTDHRLPQSWYDLDRRLLGDLDEVVNALRAWEKEAGAHHHSADNVDNAGTVTDRGEDSSDGDIEGIGGGNTSGEENSAKGTRTDV